MVVPPCFFISIGLLSLYLEYYNRENMKKWSLAFVLMIGISQLISGQGTNTLTKKEKKKGWELLFDGETTKGWHTFKQSGVGEAWKVSEGALYLDVSQMRGRGDIVTDREFGDFHMTFDWKIAPKANSGVIFLVQERVSDRATWHTGPEYQLIDNVNYPGKLDPRQMSASLYDLIACPVEFVKPAGEWNTGAIKLEKGKLQLFVNGKLAVTTVLWDENWDRLVAGSKFIKEKDFAKSRRGKIAIQDHGGMVWMRNMKIKSL